MAATKPQHTFYETLDSKGRRCIRLDRHERAIDKVPWLAYDDNKNAIVRVGWAINNGSTFGVKYE